MEGRTAASDAKRRAELGEFLRTRRERLAPAEVGLTAAKGMRRRAKGLRREEVAALAGISLPWYTSLEQGRDIRVSEQVVESLARTLRLNGQERMHLYLLADQKLPASWGLAAPSPAEPAMQLILDRLDPYPAYVTDARMNVIAWNAAADRWFGPFEAEASDRERNWLWRMFRHPAYRERFERWEASAHAALSRFRSLYARHLEDVWYDSLVEELSAADADFRRWWVSHEVMCLHPDADETAVSGDGRERLRPQLLFLSHGQDQVAVVYTPDDPAAAKRAQPVEVPRSADDGVLIP